MGKDLKDLTLATLQKDKVETVALDIYINVSQNVTLSISGAGELHLSGFFEPQRDDMDENMFLDEEEEDEEDEEIEVAGTGKVNQNLKQAKANALKNAKGGAPIPDSDDEDEDDEDEDEDEEEDSDGEPVKPVSK